VIADVALQFDLKRYGAEVPNAASLFLDDLQGPEVRPEKLETEDNPP
jgi:hypothetical protein